ncbi:L-threonylcarbamoyladenylate synthase [Acaryochloris marina]|uniref:L-threonylcarbamoyladenylate synthase n=1 Tax=Acaryochloris marina TaxID=155978 RepID=UPI001BAFFC03|nr:L-threonylcarbamoyladenylate synthase [Acaryochloris marina]QUY43767.1 L-threonylcarbamoyladenylate synthase [Acaryochloris marina S15]
MTQLPIAAFIAAARSGRLISFPTDTVPALAVRPDQASQIFAAKQRQPDKPLILMGASPEALWPYVGGSEEELQQWQQMAADYWPGALTLVLPTCDRVPPAMNPLNPDSIGIRVPNSKVAQMILQQTGPLATTSINRSGQPALTTVQDINQYFPEVFTPLVHLWPEPQSSESLPSTVIKWDGQDWEVLRQGAIQI